MAVMLHMNYLIKYIVGLVKIQLFVLNGGN